MEARVKEWLDQGRAQKEKQDEEEASDKRRLNSKAWVECLGGQGHFKHREWLSLLSSCCILGDPITKGTLYSLRDATSLVKDPVSPTG